MAHHSRRLSFFLDGVGAILAPMARGGRKDRDRDADREPYRDAHHGHGHDRYDTAPPRASRRPRRNTYDTAASRYPNRRPPSPVHGPDVERLRQARADYFTHPQEDRARRPPAPAPVTPTTPTRQDMSPRVARAASTRKNSRTKRHDDEHRRPSRKEREDRDSGVYVYSTPRSGGSRRRESREEDAVSRAGTTRRRRPQSSPDPRVVEVQVEHDTEPSPHTERHVIEVEVEREDPEPSARRADAARLNRTASAREPTRPGMTRPSLRRTGTIKASSPAAAPATPSVKHDHRRNSGIFGLFRHMPAPNTPPEKKYDCVICMDEVRASRCPKLTCGHRMCHGCLKRQFELSVKDPQHMPPTCCDTNHIPLKYVDRLFDTKFKVLWNKKYQEYTAKNRLYCPTRGCGEWVKPSHIRVDHPTGRRYGKCPRCRQKICVKCNGPWHTRKQCPNDEETQQFSEMAKEAGWQRCYNCKAMVELKEGCNHMTCRCTAQFCMLCGLKWKTCECPWFNYAHLDEEDRLQNMRVPEPYVVVEHDARGRPAVPPQPQPQQGQARPPPDAYAVPPPRQHHPVYVNEQQQARARSPAARSRAATNVRGATRTFADRDREREDEMYARRLQSQYVAEAAHDVGSRAGGGRARAGHGHHRHHSHRHRAPPPREESPEIEVEVMGVGNAAGHHMNDFGLPQTTTIRRTRTTRRATDRDRETARNMGYGVTTSTYGGAAAAAAAAATGAGAAGTRYRQQQQQQVDASVMAGLADPGRTGMGRVGMWLAYVENDPAEVEGRAQRAAVGVAY